MSALLSSEVPPPYGVRDKEEQGSWVTQASKQATKQAGERNNVFSLVAGRFVHRRTHPSEDKDKGLCFFACCSRCDAYYRELRQERNLIAWNAVRG